MHVNTQKLKELEEMRNRLALEGKESLFEKTYFKKIKYNIEDINTPVYWDGKNKNDFQQLIKSPIYNDKLREVFKILKYKNGSVLDIGFGNGEIEKILVNTKLHLAGIEISKRSVGKIRGIVNGDFKKASIYKIPFKNNSFDYVLALDVLEHLSDKKLFDALKEINRVTKSGGCLIVSVPLNENLIELIEKDLNVNGHLRMYTPNILHMELKLSGFRILKSIDLYAFKNYYFFKKIIPNFIKNLFYKPNLNITLSQKI